MSYRYEVGVRVRRIPSQPQALSGLVEDAVNAEVRGRLALLEGRLNQFNATWSASKLTDASLPTGFVIDLLGDLLREVVVPFTDLRLKMLKDVTNVVLTNEIAATGRTVDSHWGTKLKPVMLEAIQKRNAGFPTMQVVIPGAPAGYTMARYVNMLILSVIDGYERLITFQDIKPWFMSLGGITGGALEFLARAGQMVEQAKRVMASAGELIYKPIAAAFNIIDWTVKGSLAAGVAYLAWRLLK